MIEESIHVLDGSETFEDFKKTLHDGVVKFTFIKRDSSERVAYGTLHPAYLPPPPPKKEETDEKPRKPRKVNPDLQGWYDLQKHAWKSLAKSNLVSWQRCDITDVQLLCDGEA